MMAQLEAGHAIVPLWSAERASIVGDKPAHVLSLLRQYRTKTYSVTKAVAESSPH